MLALTTGMRQGELLALRWSDVHLDAGCLTVRATVQEVHGGGFVFLPPKTKRSRRRVMLSATGIAALRAHRIRQAEELLRVAEAWENLDLVFPNQVGRPLNHVHVLRRDLLLHLKRAGLPAIRFHDLRHTAATLLLGQGVNPKVVSEMLGHSHVSITLEIYSHVLPDMQQKAAAAMDAALAVQRNELSSEFPSESDGLQAK